MTTTRKCKENERRPNIIIILADDLGFSDIGCFGSEINTPNIDSLAYAEGGIRFSQFYNCSRCCPSRAALLTGKYPHQAGIGHMVYDAGVGVQYQGYLRKDVATIAEMLKGDGVRRQQRHQGGSEDCIDEENSNNVEVINNDNQSNKEKSGGYATYMVGKWHVGGEYPPDASHDWVQKTMGDDTHPIPTQRGFDQYYGTLGGGGSYYHPPSLVRDQEVVRDDGIKEGYYYTDAVNDEACSIIASMARENDDDRRPFFLYVAHCAPHWPLHAPRDECEKYIDSYMCGWDTVREERHALLIQQGIIPSTWQCSPRDEHSPPWESVENKEWEASRMACYAAQISIMDRGIGRILDALRRTEQYENTAIFFLSDNGGCAEYLKENGEEGCWPEYYGGLTRDGQSIQVGNIHGLTPGNEETFMSYGLPWANASNTPFRLFKSFVHEGGIATPLVVHWPAAARSMRSCDKDRDTNDNYNLGRICHSPWIMMDIVATCCDIAGVASPDLLEGESFRPILHGHDDTIRLKPIFWEHQGNRAMRQGPWKLVYNRNDSKVGGQPSDNNGMDDLNHWELYNMEDDRTETYNLAVFNHERVRNMSKQWLEWALSVGVKPWPLKPLPKGEKDWSNLPWLW